jgi:hypothetical protein
VLVEPTDGRDGPVVEVGDETVPDVELGVGVLVAAGEEAGREDALRVLRCGCCG